MANRVKKEWKRLLKHEKYAEVRELCEMRIKGDNIMEWSIYLKGPEDSPYKGGVWQIDVKFPANYPFSAPDVVFKTPIYHMNVQKSGEICAQMITEGWGPTMTMAHCVTILYSMMKTPNTTTPLREEIASLYSSNKAQYNKMVESQTAKFASKTVIPDA